MLNDLPADMEVLEELNISCLDPMLKDYVFSSFFLARLLDKTLKEKNELAKENEALKAKIGDYDNLKRTFEELKKTIDALDGGSVASEEPVMSEGAEAPDMKPLGFMGRNRQELEGMLEGTEEAATDTDELASSVEALLNNMDGAAEIPLGEEPSLGDVALDGAALEEVSLDAGAPAEEAAASDEDLLKALADAPVEEVSLETQGGENLEASVDELLSGLADMPAEEVPADISVDELVAGAEAILGETGEAAAIAEEAVAVEVPGVEEAPAVEEVPVEAVAEEPVVEEAPVEAVAEEPVAEEPVAVEAPVEEVAADIDIAALASETEALLNEAEASAAGAEASPEEIAAAMEALAGAEAAVEAVAPEPVVEEAAPEPEPEPVPEPVAEAAPEPAPEKPATKPKKTKAAEPEPEPEPVSEPAPEPVVEAATAEPAPEPEPEPVPEPVAEAAPEPAPAPAVEMPADPNAKMTPEQIAALIAAAGN